MHQHSQSLLRDRPTLSYLLSDQGKSMDHKTWLWKKRDSHNETIVATGKLIPAAAPVVMEAEEGRALSGRCPSNSSDRFTSLSCDCDAKEELVEIHSRMAKEAVAEREKAEAEAAYMRQELDKAQQQGVIAEERLAHLDAALKDCMQQVNSLQEELDERIEEAVLRSTMDLVKEQNKLEVKLTDANKRLTNLVAENAHLTKALLCKEKQIEDLDKQALQIETEFETLIVRLDTVEKENTFLKYECHTLEKELQVRNEEREYSRRADDAFQRQHLESEKKIEKLGAECQELRLILQRRIQDTSATVMKMKHENRVQETGVASSRRTRFKQTTHGTAESKPTLPKVGSSQGRQQANSRKGVTSAETALRPTNCEARFQENPDGDEKAMQLACYNNHSDVRSMTEGFDIHNKEGINACPESWASALLSELEHFTRRDATDQLGGRIMEGSKMNALMHHFHGSEKKTDVLNTAGLRVGSLGHHLESTDKELVPVTHSNKNNCNMRGDPARKTGYWLRDVLELIFEEQRVSKRGIVEVIEDIQIAATYGNDFCPNGIKDATKFTKEDKYSCSEVSGFLTWKPENSNSALLEEERGSPMARKSMRRIVELLEEISPVSVTVKDEDPLNLAKSTASQEYSVHILLWKTSELTEILRKLASACNNALVGKNSLEDVASEAASALEWTVSNCITLQDASHMREKIRKHHGLENSKSASELDFASADVQNGLVEMIKVQSALQEENQELRYKVQSGESAIQELEITLKSAREENDALINQLQDSRHHIASLQTDLECLTESKGMVEDQIENQKLINEDLDTQLTVTKAKSNEIIQKLSSLEVELEDKQNCCEELEAICLELQLQLEILSGKGTPNAEGDQQDGKLENGWEMTAASAKLVECQETIQHLGRQLKALASSQREAAAQERVLSSTAASATDNRKPLAQRPSLRDCMLEENGNNTEAPGSPKTKEIVSHGHMQKTLTVQRNAQTAPEVKEEPPEAHDGLKHISESSKVGSLTVAQSKKQGGGFAFIKKLFLRRKKGSNKKNAVALQRNASNLQRQREVVLAV